MMMQKSCQAILIYFENHRYAESPPGLTIQEEISSVFSYFFPYLDERTKTKQIREEPTRMYNVDDTLGGYKLHSSELQPWWFIGSSIHTGIHR
jgi:hypothetical protein